MSDVSTGPAHEEKSQIVSGKPFLPNSAVNETNALVTDLQNRLRTYQAATKKMDNTIESLNKQRDELSTICDALRKAIDHLTEPVAAPAEDTKRAY